MGLTRLSFGLRRPPAAMTGVWAFFLLLLDSSKIYPGASIPFRQV